MSKSFGRIFGDTLNSNAGNSISYVADFDRNKANIIPFTRNDKSTGYYVTDKNGNVLYSAGNSDYIRSSWEEYNQKSLRPFDNYLQGANRIDRLCNGQILYLDIENNQNANYEMPWYTLPVVGKHYVNKYNDIIERYARYYDIDADLVKAIMYNEGATGHDFGGNYGKDIVKMSKSQMPMNIRKDMWGNFDGRRYDTYIPEQNIELGVQVIKRLKNSIHNPTIEKIATLYNQTGALEVNDYGARTKTIYEQKPWLRRK